jgi:hypothetical protein
MIKLNCEESIKRYSKDHDIVKHMGKSYKVKLGFGLHTGFSIEGAIGTEFKIDATYMSRDVEFASYLESLTKEYGVNLIFSGKYMRLLSKKVKEMPQIRQIDLVQNSLKKKHELFCFDMNGIDQLPDQNEISYMSNNKFYNF